MRTMVLSCIFVAGLVLLPTSTFAACASTTEGCPSGYYRPCYWTYFGGVRRCMCHSCRPYPGGGGTSPGSYGHAEKPGGKFNRVRPNHNIGPAD